MIFKLKTRDTNGPPEWGERLSVFPIYSTKGVTHWSWVLPWGGRVGILVKSRTLGSPKAFQEPRLCFVVGPRRGGSSSCEPRRWQTPAGGWTQRAKTLIPPRQPPRPPDSLFPPPRSPRQIEQKHDSHVPENALGLRLRLPNYSLHASGYVSLWGGEAMITD